MGRLLGLATHCSKANTQARLVERKLCFISDAGNRAGMGEDSPQADSSPPNEQGVRDFIDGVGRGRGAYMQNQHSQL